MMDGWLATELGRLFLLLAAVAPSLAAQTWKPAVSPNPLPHFETVNEKRVFFADGLPFTVL